MHTLARCLSALIAVSLIASCGEEATAPSDAAGQDVAADRSDATSDSDGLADGAPNDTADLEEAPPPDPFELLPESPIYSPTCQPARDFAPPPPLATQQVLTGTPVTVFGRLVHMTTAPDGSDRVFFVSQQGSIQTAPNPGEATEATLWLQLPEEDVLCCDERGLLSIAFHPNFATNGEFFLYMSRMHRPEPEADPSHHSIVARYLVPDPPFGAPDPDSEEILLAIRQRSDNHNGGQIGFGPDGYFYIGMGDEGGGRDIHGNAQNLTTLHGAILRIDVDATEGELPYAIPDNPDFGVPDARREIWAYGLRNPWRWSFDPVDGTMWLGDVGQATREEIDRIRPGGNYGWPILEGFECLDSGLRCCETIDCDAFDAPVHDYPRSVGTTVTGGHVYRGSQLPGLYGRYVFADYGQGNIFGLLDCGPEDTVCERTLLVDTDYLVSDIGVDADGELYAVNLWGDVHRLVDADPNAVREPVWPQTLGDTGCFADLPSRTLGEGVIRYDLNVPLWSDGAAKERGLALPPEGRIDATGPGAWRLPEGTALIKTFVLEDQPVETRLLVRVRDRWLGATYRWNAEGTDATLLADAETDEIAGQTWYFPSRTDCVSCHTDVSGQVLGLWTPQLNRDGDPFATGAPLNQLDALDRVGYFVEPLPALAADLPAYPNGIADAAPQDDRVRAYLQSNCAHCHQPGGPTPTAIDLRFGTSFDETATCDAAPTQDLGVEDARVIAPGAPERSVLWLRLASEEAGEQMPPLARQLVHAEAVDLVEAWIGELECPE